MIAASIVSEVVNKIIKILFVNIIIKILLVF
jgi:hypothetical protein